RIPGEVVQVLKPVDVRDLSFIHIKGSHRNRTLEVVAVGHHIFFKRTHNRTTAFNEHHIGGIGLTLKGLNHKATRIFIVESQSGYITELARILRRGLAATASKK